MSPFQDFGVFRSQLPVDRSLKEISACSLDLQDGERACSTPTARNSFGLLPQGYCERKTPKSLKNYI